MCHWKAVLWSIGHCVTLVSEQYYARTSVLACCDFRFWTMCLKITVLIFLPLIALGAAPPLLHTVSLGCKIQISSLSFTEQVQRRFLYLLVFSHHVWSPQLWPLTKSIKHMGKKKKQHKKQQREKIDWLRPELLWQFLSFNLDYTQQSPSHWCYISCLKFVPICCSWE